MPQETCMDDPGRILEEEFCLSALSKNLQGALKRISSQEHRCQDPECVTLKTVHQLTLTMKTHQPCDGPLLRLANGKLLVTRLVTAFDQDGLHRGFHAGDFTWTSPSVLIVGRISGLTMVGTHRAPPFKPCQTCDGPFLEGRLCGTIKKSKPALNGCQVLGAYRLLFNPSKEGGEGAVRGTMEGVVICPCSS